MKLGVFSDIHDQLDHLDRLLRVLGDEHGIDVALFLGDFCSPIPARRLSAFAGTVHCVFGNGDGDRFAMHKIALQPESALRLHGEHAELELGGRRLALTHYPLYGRALARTGDYDAVFSGHTHQRHQERFGDSLWLNPGEILGAMGPPSYAVYDCTRGEAEVLDLLPSA
ncbi:MAG: metallophosphoesterase [Acidobacteriota bacterium]